ncbi:hypothetical protein KIW84_023213 [Lathyrus oleraceus]|uniref:Uncharacterized protein n=1 Tax=Pisum sativum TaxID=3888 RepID=A0A9D5B7P2_PEA|nr:hypothetical protein KIW84_023213 [Pisum sativum]
MKKFGSQKERVIYCVRSDMSNKIRLRIHHRGKFVETPVNCFSRGLRPLNNDQGVLQFSKDVVGYDVIDVYVEHSVGIPQIIDDRNINPNGVAEDGVTTDPSGGVAEEESTDPNGVVEDDVSTDPNCVAKEENIDPNVVAEDDITIDPNGVAEDDVTIDPNVVAEEGTTDIDEDYVASEGSFEDSEYQFSEESEESEMDWTKVLPQEILVTRRINHQGKWLAKTRKWLANKFASILRHNPSMKPSGIGAEAVERWGVKLSHDQEYMAKRKVMELVQGDGIEQFTHLRSYGQVLLKSNSNSTVVIQYADSNGNHVFERIYCWINKSSVTLRDSNGLNIPTHGA